MLKLIDLFLMCHETITITDDVYRAPWERQYNEYKPGNRELDDREVEKFRIWEASGDPVIAVQLKEAGA